MRVKQDEFESQMKQALGEKPKMPDGLEAALFSEAENLLSTRRERIASREAEARQMARARKRWLADIRYTVSRGLDFLAIHPDAPAAAAICVALVVAFLALHGRGHEMDLQLSYADLPALSKNNDFPARYDAQILAEKQTYEREVEDAHRRTSGGI